MLKIKTKLRKIRQNQFLERFNFFQVAAAVGNTSKVLIVDARSYPAAVGNRARGGGVECIEYYPFAEIVFMSLGNIHNIRKSFQALRVLCNQTPSDTLGARWLAALDDTKWLYHTSGLLKAASKVASALHIEARPGMISLFSISCIEKVPKCVSTWISS